MLNAVEAAKASRELPYPSADKFKVREELNAARAEYRSSLSDITNEFRAYLEAYYGTDRSADLIQKLWDASWSNGHHAGYAEVEYYYGDYSELTDAELEDLEY